MDDRLPVEVEAGVDGPVVVPLAGMPIVVPPMWQWHRRALAALLGERDDTWAELTLADADWERWQGADATEDDLDGFWIGWEQATGQNLEQIGRMAAILGRHADELESDLRAYCAGQDLRHLWQPHHGPSRLTWRLLSVLYDGLPPESATKAAQLDALDPAELAAMAKQDRDGFGPFSRTDMLIASLIDAVNRNTYVLQVVNSDPKKTKQIKPPEPVYRPGVPPRNRRRKATAETAALLAHMRANHGAMPAGWTDTTAPHAT